MNVLTEKVSQLGGKISDAKEAVGDLARSAGDQLDQTRHDAADALHTAASSVRTAGCDGADAIGKVAAGTADKLDAAASYMRSMTWEMRSPACAASAAGIRPLRFWPAWRSVCWLDLSPPGLRSDARIDASDVRPNIAPWRSSRPSKNGDCHLQPTYDL